MKKNNHLNQHGIATIVILVVIVIALAIIGGVGYKVYKKSPKSSQQNVPMQTVQGTVIKNDCSKTAAGCLDHSLASGNGSTYGLSGQKNVSTYEGQKVTVKGQVSGPPSQEVITVNTIQADPPAEPGKGTLSGTIYCTDGGNKHPCAGTIKLQTADSSHGVTATNDSVAANDQGHFSINLPPNTYYLTPAPKTGYQTAAASPPSVYVSAGQTVAAEVNYYDTQH